MSRENPPVDAPPAGHLATSPGEPDQPWASFCVATYRRPARLATTLRAIAAQTMGDFEVVVSDNDPAGSAGPVVAALGDARFHYFRNRENLGMVKNFNAALSHARGTFVAMMADDDPPLPHMLATLRSLSEQHPSYGAYYGACEVFFENEEVAAGWLDLARRREGLADRLQGEIRTFSAAEFPLAFLKQRVLWPVLWSAGIVRRDIALAIGGVPDDEAIFANDLAYIALAGAHSGCATVNLPLARSTRHSGSFLASAHRIWAGRCPGDEYWQELKRGIDGCQRCLAAAWSDRPDWHLIRPSMERWLAKRCHGYLLGAYVLKHGGAEPPTLEALRDGMTAMRFMLSVPTLREPRFLWLTMHRWWVRPLARAGRCLRWRVYRAIERLRWRAHHLVVRIREARRSPGRPASGGAARSFATREDSPGA